MRFSQALIKTQKEKSKEADSINADFLHRASCIDQLSAGIYTFLPLGLRVLKKIENIVREEMTTFEGQEVVMPVLQPKENWEKTGRWESLDVLYRFTSHYSKNESVLGPTHEEVVAPMMKRFIFSYKDLPRYVFQIQTKFRDEKRAKAGLLRGREFLMKDLYSFHTDEADLDRYYLEMKKAYLSIYNRLGIGDKTYYTFASGGSFSKYSHEFQTESASGEDLIYLCEKCKVAINKEIIEEQKECPECGNKALKEIKAIEVGNIFKLGTKYSKPFNLSYLSEDNKEHDVVMGCYGIGISRLMGAIVEVSHDKDGIIWPASVAPFEVHLVHLDGRKEEAEAVYKELTKAGLEVLWDDRDETPGVKLADADLLGVPIRLVVSNRAIEKNRGIPEIKLRNSSEPESVEFNENLVDHLKELLKNYHVK